MALKKIIDELNDLLLGYYLMFCYEYRPEVLNLYIEIFNNAREYIREVVHKDMLRIASETPSISKLSSIDFIKYIAGLINKHWYFKSYAILYKEFKKYETKGETNE